MKYRDGSTVSFNPMSVESGTVLSLPDDLGWDEPVTVVVQGGGEYPITNHTTDVMGLNTRCLEERKRGRDDDSRQVSQYILNLGLVYAVRWHFFHIWI